MIGLYGDKELTQPIQQQLVNDKLTWVLRFGYIDAGQERDFPFFIENQSLGAIEDLEIKLDPIDRDDVYVSVTGNKVSRLPANGVHMFVVGWSVSQDARAGRCRANLSIKGMITEE